MTIALGEEQADKFGKDEQKSSENKTPQLIQQLFKVDSDNKTLTLKELDTPDNQDKESNQETAKQKVVNCKVPQAHSFDSEDFLASQACTLPLPRMMFVQLRRHSASYSSRTNLSPNIRQTVRISRIA